MRCIEDAEIGVDQVRSRLREMVRERRWARSESGAGSADAAPYFWSSDHTDEQRRF